MPRSKKNSRRPVKRERIGGLTVTVQRSRRKGYEAVVVMRQGGKRKRERYFRTRIEAEALWRQWSIEAGNTGADAAASLTDAEKRFLVEARETLEPFGKTLRDAMSFYVEHLKSQHSSKPVGIVVDALLLHRQKKGKSVRYQQDLQHRLTRFQKDFEGRMIAQITADEVERWLEGLTVAPVTQNNYRRILHVLWSFAVSKHWAPANVVGHIEPQTVRPERPGILNLGQVRALLDSAEHEILPYLAIALFAGLRDEELRRLDWRDVNLLTGYISISAQVSKTGRERMVSIPENLKAWLQPFAKARGRVTPPNARKLLEDAREAAEISEWPHNATRHSFGTYELARTKNIGHVSEHMGNSPAVVQRHYKAAVAFELGDEYFAIFPATRSNITVMQPSAA